MNVYLNTCNEIEGWFYAEYIVPVLQKIDSIQSIPGNILEIGVHHGKSFIPMIFLLKQNEVAVAVDVFEDQMYNYDNSGMGDWTIFTKNINKVFNHDYNIYSRLKIIKEDSTKLLHSDYIKYSENNLKYRIISIDGCHTKNATIIDLMNAINLLTEDGVIIMDDYENTDWPGVKEGVDYVMENNPKYCVFYNSYNKYIICNKKFYDKFIYLNL